MSGLRFEALIHEYLFTLWIYDNDIYCRYRYTPSLPPMSPVEGNLTSPWHEVTVLRTAGTPPLSVSWAKRRESVLPSAERRASVSMGAGGRDPADSTEMEALEDVKRMA